MKHTLTSLTFLWLASLATASTASFYAPITLTTHLDDMALTVESSLMDEIALLEINNQDNQAATCQVTFNNGPEPQTIRKAHLSAGTKKLISRSFGRSIISLKINVDCKKVVI